MREICTSGSVGGEDGDILTYPARKRAASLETPDFASAFALRATADKSLIRATGIHVFPAGFHCV